MDFLVAQPYDMVGGAGVEPASVDDTLFSLSLLIVRFPTPMLAPIWRSFLVLRVY